MAFSSPILKSPLIKVNRRKISSSSFRPINNTASISSTLEETNKILVEIQQQIGIAFGMRNAEEKEKNENLKKERSRRRLRLREGALESVKKIGGAIKKTAKFVASPFKGFFDKILEFISLLGLGIGANAIFGWFEKKENREKISKFFNIITSNWKLIRNILGVIGGAILLGKIFAFAGAIAGLVSFITGPFAAAIATALGAAALIGAIAYVASKQDLGEKQKELVKKLEEMGGVTPENREKLIKELEKEKAAKMSGPTGGAYAALTGELAEIDNAIRFVKTGEYGYGKSFQFDYGLPFNYQMGGKANLETLKQENPFGFSMPEQPEARAMGGPVMAGNTYLVGEKGPELFSPNIDGSIINNMKTEKIYEMISSKNAGKINFVSMELPPKFMNSGKNASTEEQQEIPIPTISAVNGSNPYMSITPNVYGIYV